MPARPRRARFLSLLPEPLWADLDRLEGVARAVARGLLEGAAARRVAALEALGGLLVQEGAPGAQAQALLPFVLALATAPKYPGGAALLVRLSQLLGCLDEPPGALATREDVDGLRQTLLASRGPLARVAERGRDPQAARIAACLLARLPEPGPQLPALLVALLSGAPDAEERARVLYALARVQLALGQPLHARATAATRAPEASQPDVTGEAGEAVEAGAAGAAGEAGLAGEADGVGARVEALAVRLALAEREPAEPMRGELRGALERAARAGPLPDPRAWGTLLSGAELERIAARLVE